MKSPPFGMSEMPFVGVPVALPLIMDFADLHGTGCVKCGTRDLGRLPYHVEIANGGHASVVKFEERPAARDGETLHLTLEDGRMLDCQVLDASPYCAVVGDGPYPDRRTMPR
jgi:hypothetical protein